MLREFIQLLSVNIINTTRVLPAMVQLDNNKSLVDFAEIDRDGCNKSLGNYLQEEINNMCSKHNKKIERITTDTKIPMCSECVIEQEYKTRRTAVPIIEFANKIQEMEPKRQELQAWIDQLTT